MRVLTACLVVTVIAMGVASAVQLKLVSQYPFGPPYDLVAGEGYLFVGTGCEVRVWDIHDEAKIPKLNWNNSIASVNTKSLVMGLDLKGRYLYVAGQKDFEIIDVSDPRNPKVVATLDNPNPEYNFQDVVVKGNYAYLTGKNVYVVDVSSENPRILATVPIEGGWRMNVSGDLLFVTTKKGILYIVNISDPTNPNVVGTWNSNYTTPLSSVAVKDNYAFVVRYHYGLFVLDVSDPSNPKLLAEITDYPKQTYNYNDIKILGNYAYVSVRYKGIDVIDLSNPTNPTVIGHATGFPAYAEGIFPYKAPSGKIYAFLAGHSIGVAIYDVTNPSNPVMVDWFHTLGGARGLAVGDGYLFVGSHNDGVWIVNVTDPYKPKEVAFVYLSGRFGDLALKDNYLYAAGVWGLLNVIDVSNPKKPVVVASSLGKPTAKPILIDGNWLYAMWSITDDHILVYNITDPANPNLAYDYDMSPYLGRIYGFAKFGGYLLVASNSGLFVVDVSDKSKFNVVGSWSNGKEIKDVSTYGTCAVVIYQGGVSVLDLSDPASPKEVGSLTLPGASPEALLVFSNYAFIGAFNRIFVIDLSDVSNPSLVQEVDLPGGRIHEIVTDGTFLYASAVYYGVYIFELEGLPLTVYDVKVEDVDQDSAVVTWRTNYDSDSLVKYGTSPGNYTSQVYDSSLVRFHRLALKGLTPSTTYYFRVVSKTNSLSAESSEFSFTTKEADITPPIVTIVYPPNNSVLVGGVGTVRIEIRTDEPAYCQYSFNDFEYGNGINFTFGQGGTVHSFNLSVEDGRTYVLYYKCSDKHGNVGSRVHVFSVATKWWDNFKDTGGISSMSNVDVGNGVRLVVPANVVNPSKDAQISPVKGWSNGESTKMSVGSCGRYRDVLEFKLPNGTGEIGLIKLYVYDLKSVNYGEGNELEVYLLEGSFDEGSVNWTHRDSTQKWNNPGGDYSKLLATFPLKPGVDYSNRWICLNLTGDFKWGQDVSLLIKMKNESGLDYRTEQFGTKESQFRPYMVVLPPKIVGEVVSKPITPENLASWDKFYANYTTPPNTKITFSILNAETGEVLLSNLTGHGDDISAISANSIKIKAVLSSEDPPNTPIIFSWSVSWNTQSASERKLIISNVKVVNVTSNSATVVWQTNYVSDSLVKYGTSPGNYEYQAYDPSYVLNHTVTITGLKPETTYYFVVQSTDLNGNSASSLEFSFETLKMDTTPPNTTYVIHPKPNDKGWINVTPVTVTFFRYDDCGVAYTNYSTSKEGSWKKVEGDEPFNVTLNDTTTIWFYSVDVNGNVEPIKNVTVRIDCEPPKITNVSVFKGERSAIVTWDTNENTTALVEYGIGAYDHVVADENCTKHHSIELFNLSEGKYVFRIVSIDPAGNTACYECNFTIFEYVNVIWRDDFSNNTNVEMLNNTEITNGIARIEFNGMVVYPSKDAHISPISGWSSGNKPKLWVGSCDRYRTILEFRIPNGTGEIGLIKLYVYDLKSVNYGEGNELEVYLLEGSFEEGSVNWTHRDSTQKWNNPGGDYSKLLATFPLKPGVDYSNRWICLNLSNISLKWGSTVGFLIKMRNGSGLDYRCEQFGSRESEWKPHVELIPSKIVGEVVSKPITPENLASWDKFYANYTTPPNTKITFSILNAETGEVLCSGLTGNGDDISNCIPPDVKSIRLKAELVTRDPPNTPMLFSWAISWKAYKSK